MPIDPEKLKKFQKGFNNALDNGPGSNGSEDETSGSGAAAQALAPKDPTASASDLLTKKKKGS